MSKQIPQVLFISDFHTGEKLGSVRTSILPGYKEWGPSCFVRKELNDFLKILTDTYGINKENRVKYLLIMGDQWDLAVQPMPYSFNLSLDFFKNSRLQDYIEEIIYIPGNHDHHIWRMYQTRYCVTEQLEKEDGEKCTDYPQITTAYLDLRGDQPQLKLETEGLNPAPAFLTGLTGEAKIPVTIIYPNLYIIHKNKMNQSEATLCTHGHLFDAAWNLVTDAIYSITKKFHSQGKRFDLHDIEMLNSPVTEFWNYSMAQTGKYNLIDKFYDLYLVLQNLLLGILKTILKSEKKKFTDTLQRGEKIIEKDFMLINKVISEKSDSEIEDILKDCVENVTKKAEETLALYKKEKKAGNKKSEFLYHNKDRVVHYIEESLKYLKPYNLSKIARLMYGHTHQPENQTNFNPEKTGINLTVYNTGGWVAVNEKDYPELFLLFADGTITPLSGG